jgi:CRISPR-associated protein Cas1
VPLFLAGQGSRLKAWGGRLSILEPGATDPVELPLSLLSSITTLGQVHIDQYVVRACLRHQVALHLCTQAGALLGSLNLPGDAPTASLALAQADFCRDEARCLAVAREMIAQKIANCREVLSRQRERDQFDALAMAELKQAETEARQAGSAGGLRGVEGRAAAVYFERWQRLIPSELGFAGRSFRPAEDPLNALLNFGYALLYRQLSGLLQIERLNPHLGVFHRPSDYYHPLACDLQEEFRCLVDLMALRLVHLGQIGRGDFRWREKPQPGWWLGEEARRVVIRYWQERLEEPYRPGGGQPETTLRRVMHRQARRLRELIQEPEKTTYQPFRLA